MSNEQECKHDDNIECYDQEWVSGDCLRLDLQCSTCGRKGSLSVVLDPTKISWEMRDKEAEEILRRGYF